MTIAVALKVRDGIVLAADSATTLSGSDGVENIYNHANKIVNLCKGKPIGFMTWGLGSFGEAAVATLAKDFRAEVWHQHFDQTYTVQDVASRMREFLHTAGAQAVNEMEPAMRPFGFLVAGHTPDEVLGEAWVVEVDEDGNWAEPTEVLPGNVGVGWWGQPRWIQRLILGFDPNGLAVALVDKLGLPEQELGTAMQLVQEETQAPFINPAMPIQDAINLGGFLVDVTKISTEFNPGDLTVGGPTEIAAITKHEGFKWIVRKHYYDRALNPEED